MAEIKKIEENRTANNMVSSMLIHPGEMIKTNANIWLGLQAEYNMQKVKQDKSFMKRLENIRKIAVFL